MISRLSLSSVVAVALTAMPATITSPVDPASLVVHEWGTFTTVAGRSGDPVPWGAVDGAADLPCFVRRFPLPKTALGGTVRMETPVIYFYSPRDATIDVSVQFRQGAMTEWYPHAAVTPSGIPREGIGAPGFAHRLSWTGVRIVPAGRQEYPREDAPSHYYAARETDASRIEVGAEGEKFLFYRGVGRFAIPVNATVDPDGTIAIRNTGDTPLGGVILFENHAGRIGFRIHDTVSGSIVLDPPGLTSDVDQLAIALEQMLTAQGLFPNEARAMIETWRDSWFEPGTRLFYLVPGRLIDRVLPLTIDPRPAAVARVFVGRVELITASAEQEVASALELGEPAALAKYGRFLPSIVERLHQAASLGRAWAARAIPSQEQLDAHPALQSAYKAIFASGRTCESVTTGR